MRKGLKYKQEQDHNDQDNYCFEAHDISSFKKRLSSVDYSFFHTYINYPFYFFHFNSTNITRQSRKAPCFSNGNIRRKFFLLFVWQAAILYIGRRTFGVSLWSGDVGRHREAGTPNTKAPRGISWRIPAL